MIKVYCELLPNTSYVPLLFPSLGPSLKGAQMFLNNAFNTFNEQFVTIVNTPAQSDYILIPHNLLIIKDRTEYLYKQYELSKQYNKKIIFFLEGDIDVSIPFEHSIVFRTSQYKSKLKHNEIIMPASTEDLLGNGELVIREKLSTRPMVGFCGWANHKNVKSRIHTFIHNITATSFNQNAAYKKGLSFRIKAIKILKKSDLVQTNFIIRSSFSGHKATIVLDPATAREQYKNNLINSDLALAIKGDGNYSLRFYEALSVGRVPLLVDTDCVLPLANIIDYDSFCMFVDYTDLYQLDLLANKQWNEISNKEYHVMQKKAREAYTTYLNPKSFLQYVCQNIL